MNKNQTKVEELLKQCEIAECGQNYEKLIELSDEILEISPDNPIAIGFKSFAFIKLKQYDNAGELLDLGCELYPENCYLKSNLAMLYYDLGEYEKSLECCEEGLKIKEHGWLCERKIMALIKLDRIEEAIDFYENIPVLLDIKDMLIEEGKYLEALDYCIKEDSNDIESLIDKAKDFLFENNLEMPDEIGNCYIGWIYRIRHVNNTRVCPDCGGKLIPIVWGYPTPEMMQKAGREEIFLGGCVIGINPANYRCRNCGHEFDLGHKGFAIEYCDERDYVIHKIDELTSRINEESPVKSLKNLKEELKGFDDEEFDAFIGHLKDIGFIHEPAKGNVELL